MTLAAGGLPVSAVQLIAFLILLAVLHRFVFTRIAAAMRARSKRLQATFDEIRSKQDGVERTATEYTEKLRGIEAEARRRIDSAVQEGDRMRKEIETQAKKEREGRLARLQEEIRIEREKAVLELRQEAARMAVELADRVVAASVDDPMQQRLVARYLEALERVQRV